MTNSYNMQDNEKIQIILNWLGGEGLQFMQTLQCCKLRREQSAKAKEWIGYLSIMKNECE